MTTEREKISCLAKSCGATYLHPGRLLIDLDELEAFYHMAQAEAFESAANKVEEMFDLGYRTPRYYIATTRLSQTTSMNRTSEYVKH